MLSIPFFVEAVSASCQSTCGRPQRGVEAGDPKDQLPFTRSLLAASAVARRHLFPVRSRLADFVAPGHCQWRDVGTSLLLEDVPKLSNSNWERYRRPTHQLRAWSGPIMARLSQPSSPKCRSWQVTSLKRKGNLPSEAP